MTRRNFTAVAAAGAALQATPPKSKMGIAVTCYMSYRKIRDADALLERCAQLGAGGIQAGAPVDAAKFRARAEQLGMYYEVYLPFGEGLEAAVVKAKQAGALAGRIGALGGRRYETFSTLESWNKFVSDARPKIAAASQAAAAHKFTIGIENHKDWTLDEQLGLMKEFGHEHFGTLLDTGNNISLLDDPYEHTEKLAPYTVLTHIKDMGWQEHPQGFEMSEMPLGEGTLDMKRIVAAIRKARPETRMTLEMITRDPLLVPCLGEKYWLTMGDRKAKHLAGTLRMVRTVKARQPLPRMEQLTATQRIEEEEDNIKRCLNTAREKLGL